AVAEELPIRTLRQDLGGATALVLAVVPFDQIGIGCRHRGEAGQLARPERTSQGTGEHPGERQRPPPLSQPAWVALAALSQREIREPGVLPRERPRRLPVPRQVDDGKTTHTTPPALRDATSVPFHGSP